MSMLFELQYAAARVRALRGNLLNSEELGNISNAKTKEELISNIDRNTYENIFTGDTAEYIESQLDMELVKTIEKITGFLPEKFRDDFRIYALRWDLHNIKLMIRGLYADMDLSEIKKDMIKTGNIWDMVQQEFPEDIGSIRRCLEGSIWEQDAIEIISAYKEKGQVKDAERILDTRYMSVLRTIKTAPLKEYMQAEIIMKDALTIIRAKKDNIDAGNQLLILEHMEIPAQLSHIKGDDPESNIELALSRIARVKLLGDPFGIGLYIDYIRQKHVEINALKHAAQRLWD